MTRNAIKYYIQTCVAIGLILSAALSVVPIVTILFVFATGATETKEFDELLAVWASAMSLIVPFMAWGIWSQRKANLRRGITADFLGSLSWRERKEFWKKQKSPNDNGASSN
jgi:hypothetical protein